MSYITKITMGDIIKRLITLRGYTNRYIAEKSGLNDTYISKVKNDKNNRYAFINIKCIS